MKLLVSLSLCLVSQWSLTEASRPRGVRVELASMYNPNQDFKCFDGSNVIPFSQVNDDYCDCEDGSDEPGTSACAGGKFYCENAGHKPTLLLSSRVGDGICDCCDGSDEWSGLVTCSNTCNELGRAAREAAEARVRVIQEGLNKRQVMVQEAQTQLEEKKLRLQEKETKKSELEAVKEEKQKLKEEAEAPEKEALDYYRKIEEEVQRREEEEKAARTAAEAESYFRDLDTDQNGEVSLAELQARPGLDTNKDGEVTEEEAKFFLGDKESFSLETFKEGAFALMKPYLDLEQTQSEEPVEESVEEVPSEEYHPPDHPMMTPSPLDAEIVPTPDYPMNTPPPPTDIDDDYHEDRDDEEEEDYDISDQDEDMEAEAREAEAEKPESKYDEATQRLIEAAEAARKAYNDADRELRDIEREVKQLSETLEKNYGEDSVFAVLHGKCFEYTDNEYTYKMCPFDFSSQRGKHGGAETRLGSWGEWTGPEEDKHSSMKFTGGQTCWNGPARSTQVYLHCGSDNILSAVSEPNRCEYEMHFTTPAVCRLQNNSAGHDEL